MATLKYKTQRIIDDFVNYNYRIHIWHSDNIMYNDTVMYNNNVLYNEAIPIALAAPGVLYINSDTKCKALTDLKKTVIDYNENHCKNKIDNIIIEFVSTKQLYECIDQFGEPALYNDILS